MKVIIYKDIVYILLMELLRFTVFFFSGLTMGVVVKKIKNCIRKHLDSMWRI